MVKGGNKQNMKQRKHKYCTSIWAHPKKGVRAGNSPVWKPKPLRDNEEDWKGVVQLQPSGLLIDDPEQKEPV